MILVFGATGRTGKSVVEQLIKKNAKVRVLVRNAAKAQHLAARGVDVIEGEISDESVLSNAFEHVEKVYLLLGNSEAQLVLEKKITDMAVAAKVKLLVKQSSLESLPNATKPIPQLHVASENYIKQSGLNWVMLRPTFFVQMLLTCSRGVANNDTLSFPMGKGVVAVTDARDVADVAALVLTTPGHENKSYDLSGPELLSFATIAALMSQIVGRPIAYNDLPLAVYREQLTKILNDEWRINAVCAELDALATDTEQHVTSNISKLLGRPARSTAEFIKDYQKAFSPL